MEILFVHGNVNLEKAQNKIEHYAEFHEANPGIVNATSYANYVMPRESNRYEGYIRFPFPLLDDPADGSASELHIYFSPRAKQPYRISFLYRDPNGTAGFDISSQLWAHRSAASLGLNVQREIDRPTWSDPMDG